MQFKKFKLPMGDLVFSVLFTVLFFLALFYWFEAWWMSNDDIGMSMRAHGYGNSAQPSPMLIFSNVLWGYIVGFIPDIDGIFGYSIATITVLMVTFAAVEFAILKSGFGYMFAAVFAVLIFTRVALFQHFTINSGLLMVTASYFFVLYSCQKNNAVLLFGLLFSCLSFILRWNEFIFILIISIPFFPWKLLRFDPQFRIACAFLLSFVCVSLLINSQAYNKDDWREFSEYQKVRVKYIDYGAGDTLLKRDDILQKHQYSQNDIRLISSWFSVYPKIADPSRLTAMLDDLGEARFADGGFERASYAIEVLMDSKVLPVLAAGVAMAVILPSLQIYLSWLLFISIILTLGVLGRPGILWVYIPALSFLAIAPLMPGSLNSLSRRRLAFFVVSLAATWNFYVVKNESAEYTENAHVVYENFIGRPQRAFVAWADSFPYEKIYPVFSRRHNDKFIIYALASSTLAPTSVAYKEEAAGRGFISRFNSIEGVEVIARAEFIELMPKFCEEHFRGVFRLISTIQYESFSVSRIACY